MEDQPTTFTVEKITDDTKQMRLLTLTVDEAWNFVPGQVAILGLPDIGESYFAIASAPEDKQSMQFLIREGKGVAEALYSVKKGDKVQGKGPIGKGFPIDNYHGRDLIIAAVGSAIAPMRSVLKSICHRRADFGKIAMLYGIRHPEDFPFMNEIADWKKENIDVIVTISRPEGKEWSGKTGYVQAHFEEVLKQLKQPVALMCGMKEMMEQCREEFINMNIAPDEVLTNY
jgi:sulfhydrogenase subunit gamma (sulfur reductase)